jgi:predicted  nucleic acid-binding Zn-ribbon protein
MSGTEIHEVKEKLVEMERQISRLLGVVEGHSAEIDALKAEILRLKGRRP